ncbi:MAG: hypothetical protein ABSG46_11690 [Candidatus Binataceae bacterium]|jgi:hypothetical protein
MGIIDTIKDGIDAVGAARLSKNARSLAYKETEIAKSVFGDTVPYSQVYITDGLGVDGREYTFPRPFTSPRQYIIHAGDGYYGMSFLPKDKQTLVHELTHVWQGEHSHWAWSYVFSSAGHQALGSAYKYDPKNMKDWDSYNPEQQAQIVEDWYKDGADEDDYRYHYIIEDIQGKMMAPRLPVTEEITIPERSVVSETRPPITDDYITQLLAKRYAANDVAGFGGRVKTLEGIFREIDIPRAKSILSRLSIRRAGDMMSIYFHDHLSTATRASLIAILQRR